MCSRPTGWSRPPGLVLGATSSLSPLPTVTSGGMEPPCASGHRSTPPAAGRELPVVALRPDRVGDADDAHGTRAPLPDDLLHAPQRLGRVGAQLGLAKSNSTSFRTIRRVPRGASSTTTTLAPGTSTAPPREMVPLRGRPPCSTVTSRGSGGGPLDGHGPVARSVRCARTASAAARTRATPAAPERTARRPAGVARCGSITPSFDGGGSRGGPRRRPLRLPNAQWPRWERRLARLRRASPRPRRGTPRRDADMLSGFAAVLAGGQGAARLARGPVKG